MIRDNHNTPIRVAECVVTTHLPNPMEADCFHDLAQVSKRDKPQPGHAATSMRSVPMKSGNGSSTSVDCR